MQTSPKLLWEWGTAYDLFISLEVLHNPKDFGVRSAWASSVRKRLPTDVREILEQGLKLFHIPFHWVHKLPDPKDALTVLFTLGQIPAEERLQNLALLGVKDNEIEQFLIGVAAKGQWTDSDLTYFLTELQKIDEKKASSREKLENILDWWARSKEFGERYLAALHTYQEVFFSEEEKRIGPALKSAFERGKRLEAELPLPDLIEELSQGIRFTELPEMEELVLAPSFWVTPLMYFGKTDPNRGVWLYGGRSATESLVPGENVPESLVRALKSLSDPTRLRILHYLTQKPHSPAQLARNLRLRPPTVTHHLQALRLAGLVQVTLGGDGKEKKSFAARSEAIKATCAALESFLEAGMSSSAEGE